MLIYSDRNGGFKIQNVASHDKRNWKCQRCYIKDIILLFSETAIGGVFMKKVF